MLRVGDVDGLDGVGGPGGEGDGVGGEGGGVGGPGRGQHPHVQTLVAVRSVLHAILPVARLTEGQR